MSWGKKRPWQKSGTGLKEQDYKGRGGIAGPLKTERENRKYDRFAQSI
jgi:hypothetical protein